VRDAVTSFIEYIPIVHSPEAILELVEGRETAEIRWRVGPDLGFNHQANYKAALLNLKLLRMVGGRGFRPSHVDLAVDPHERDIPELERQLGAKFNRTPSINLIKVSQVGGRRSSGRRARGITLKRGSKLTLRSQPAECSSR
jgi:hypothetical protein